MVCSGLMKGKRDNFPGFGFKFKSCSGKKKYASRAEANSALSTQRRYGEKIDGIRPYQCPFCEGWHLGHEMTDEE